MVNADEALELHKRYKGKIEILPKVRASTKEDLSIFYTPGVAYVTQAIKEDKEKSYVYTNRQNTIAIVTDGTRILGLGNVGPEAGMPVMEGKALLFKRLGGVDAVPLCIATTDESEIVKFVQNIAPSFGGINIEDIETPKAVRIVNRLTQLLDIPIFHDDQYGTATVVAAALLNALKLRSSKLEDVKIIINGAGSAGYGIFKLLTLMGARQVYVFDSQGLLYKGRKEHMNELKEEIANASPASSPLSLSEAVKGADVLIGVSTAGAFTKEMIKAMNPKPIVFALANPVPEIGYEEAKDAGAYVVATGRSDKPNQVNNLLVFPGVMRGLLDCGAKRVDYELLAHVAKALAKTVGRRLSPEFIIPSVSNDRDVIKIASTVASAVVENAVKRSIAKFNLDPAYERRNTVSILRRYLKIEKRIVGKLAPSS